MSVDQTVPRIVLNGRLVDALIFAALLAMPLMRGGGELFFGLASMIGLVYAWVVCWRQRSVQIVLNRLRPLRWVILAMWCLFALKVASLCWSGHTKAGLHDIGTHFHFFMFPFLVLFLSQSKQAAMAARWGMMCALIGVGAWAIVFLSQGHSPADRFSAYAGNALVLGLIINLYMAALLTRVFAQEHAPRAGLEKTVLVLALIGAAVGLYANNSRAAWLLALLLILLTLGLKVYHRATWKWAAWGVLALLAVWGVFEWHLKASLMQALAEWQAASHGAGQANSLGLRYGMYHGAWQAFWNAPWFGVGVGGVQAAVAPYTGFATEVMEFRHVHNQFLQLMVELGVLGLVVYVAFLSSVFRFAASQWNQNPRIALFLVVWVLLVMLGGVSNVVFKQGLQSSALLLLLALSARLVDSSDATSPQSKTQLAD